jgi:predicted ABC-type transport system involved in lysophospholipase L1 biosynthesis ATPase subunit
LLRDASSDMAVASLAYGVLTVLLLDGKTERGQLVAEHPDAVQVTARLPLRANLTVLENISIVPQFRRGESPEAAARYAWSLLERIGYTACAQLRDPDLSHEERFAAKLLRAVALRPSIILIDRPGRLLPDTYYPPFVEAMLAALKGEYGQCWVLDYVWNAPLYPHRRSDDSS